MSATCPAFRILATSRLSRPSPKTAIQQCASQKRFLTKKQLTVKQAKPLSPPYLASGFPNHNYYSSARICKRDFGSSVALLDKNDIANKETPDSNTPALGRESIGKNENAENDSDDKDREIGQALFDHSVQHFGRDMFKVTPRPTKTFLEKLKKFYIEVELKGSRNSIVNDWDRDEFLAGAKIAFEETAYAVSIVSEAAYDAGKRGDNAAWIEQGFDNNNKNSDEKEGAKPSENSLFDSYSMLEQTWTQERMGGLKDMLRDVYHTAGVNDDLILVTANDRGGFFNGGGDDTLEIQDFNMAVKRDPVTEYTHLVFRVFINIAVNVWPVLMKYKGDKVYGHMRHPATVQIILDTTTAIHRVRPGLSLPFENKDKVNAMLKLFQEDEIANQNRQVDWKMSHFPLFRGFPPDEEVADDVRDAV